MKSWSHRQQTLRTRLRLNAGTLRSQVGATPFLNSPSLAVPPRAPDALQDEPATAWLGPGPSRSWAPRLLSGLAMLHPKERKRTLQRKVTAVNWLVNSTSLKNTEQQQQKTCELERQALSPILVQ